jgi:hypothetical protein
MEMDLKETGWDNADLVDLAQDTEKRPVVLKTVKIFHISKDMGIYSLAEKLLAF